MNANIKLPKKQMYIILFALGFIILSMSLNVMMRVKDIGLYDLWFNDMVNEDLGITYDSAFSIYVTGNLAAYFLKMFVPIALGIHTYFAYTKIRISQLFVFIWSVLLIGSMLYVIVEKQFGSIFYYSNIIGYVVLILTILSLGSVINEENIS